MMKKWVTRLWDFGFSKKMPIFVGYIARVEREKGDKALNIKLTHIYINTIYIYLWQT